MNSLEPRDDPRDGFWPERLASMQRQRDAFHREAEELKKLLHAANLDTQKNAGEFTRLTAYLLGPHEGIFIGLTAPTEAHARVRAADLRDNVAWCESSTTVTVMGYDDENKARLLFVIDGSGQESSPKGPKPDTQRVWVLTDNRGAVLGVGENKEQIVASQPGINFKKRSHRVGWYGVPVQSVKVTHPNGSDVLYSLDQYTVGS